MKVLKRLKIEAKMPVSIIRDTINNGLSQKLASSLLKNFSKDFKFNPSKAKTLKTDYDASGFRVIVEFNNGIILYGLYDAFGSFKSGAVESSKIKEPRNFYYSSILEDSTLKKIVVKINNSLESELDKETKDYLIAINKEIQGII